MTCSARAPQCHYACEDSAKTEPSSKGRRGGGSGGELANSFVRGLQRSGTLIRVGILYPLPPGDGNDAKGICECSMAEMSVAKSQAVETNKLLASHQGYHGRGKRETREKTRRPVASSGMISTCENPEITPPILKPSSPRLAI
ncbi:hypothetical protein PR048_032051 [Dryococelus australis]|uniref:Uncharacterized protein n=1 Tax=Dryococelus australis TaxID=614101 RepID=A0ABQ9G202_9NEOP|nr:hypothetical protein PR048_032051 [Dryococelus australis]